jgi:phosphatidylserine/phosphatidylglycerophosphate/cardiolipin synthase-like enzyme
VSLIVEPDDGPKAVLDLIAGARRSVWMEMYLLTSADAIAALAGRAAAGCEVRVILEPNPYQADGANQAAYDALAAAGVDVRWATARFTFTHAKTFVVDHARLAVMTLNLTMAGTSGNREYAVLDDDPADVAAAEAIFAADAAGAVAGAAARVVTSPDASRAAIAGLIDGAARSLAIETEELTDPAIASALGAARARGVAVTVVWPGPGGGGAFAALAATGARVRSLADPAIHAKAIVADETALYVGSANLTPTSLDENREIGLALADAGTAARVASVIAGDAARGAPP